MLCSISKSLSGRYRVSFFNERFIPVDDSTPTAFLNCLDRLDVYKKLFDKLCNNETRDYDYEALCRSKKQVIEYGENNEWTYFVTITFDVRKINRDDCRLVYDKVRKACNHYKERVDNCFKYVLLPEYHSDEKHIHFHGLFYVSSGNADITGPYTGYNDKTRRRFDYYRSEFFFRRFGAINLQPVATNSLYVSAYITKYITKQQFMIFGNRYCCSQGLQVSENCFVREREFAGKLYTAFNHLTLPDGSPIKPVSLNKYTFSYSLDETQFELLGMQLLNEVEV